MAQSGHCGWRVNTRFSNLALDSPERASDQTVRQLDEMQGKSTEFLDALLEEIRKHPDGEHSASYAELVEAGRAYREIFSEVRPARARRSK